MLFAADLERRSAWLSFDAGGAVEAGTSTSTHDGAALEAEAGWLLFTLFDHVGDACVCGGGGEGACPAWNGVVCTLSEANVGVAIFEALGRSLDVVAARAATHGPHHLVRILDLVFRPCACFPGDRLSALGLPFRRSVDGTMVTLGTVRQRLLTNAAFFEVAEVVDQASTAFAAVLADVTSAVRSEADGSLSDMAAALEILSAIPPAFAAASHLEALGGAVIECGAAINGAEPESEAGADLLSAAWCRAVAAIVSIDATAAVDLLGNGGDAMATLVAIASQSLSNTERSESGAAAAALAASLASASLAAGRLGGGGSLPLADVIRALVGQAALALAPTGAPVAADVVAAVCDAVAAEVEVWGGRNRRASQLVDVISGDAGDSNGAGNIGGASKRERAAVTAMIGILRSEAVVEAAAAMAGEACDTVLDAAGDGAVDDAFNLDGVEDALLVSGRLLSLVAACRGADIEAAFRPAKSPGTPKDDKRRKSKRLKAASKAAKEAASAGESWSAMEILAPALRSLLVCCGRLDLGLHASTSGRRSVLAFLDGFARATGEDSKVRRRRLKKANKAASDGSGAPGKAISDVGSIPWSRRLAAYLAAMEGMLGAGRGARRDARIVLGSLLSGASDADIVAARRTILGQLAEADPVARHAALQATLALVESAEGVQTRLIHSRLVKIIGRVASAVERAVGDPDAQIAGAWLRNAWRVVGACVRRWRACVSLCL